MCDYSLHHVASRPATVGDKLVSTKFVNTPTGGFAAVDNPNVAVCLRPGTELAFERDVECEPALGILPSRKIGQRLARFRQINVEQPCVHHDALEFPDGKIVLVTRLREGQQATVLQMPAAVGGGQVAAAGKRRRRAGAGDGARALAVAGRIGSPGDEGIRSVTLREPRACGSYGKMPKAPASSGTSLCNLFMQFGLMHNGVPRSGKIRGNCQQVTPQLMPIGNRS